MKKYLIGLAVAASLALVLWQPLSAQVTSATQSIRAAAGAYVAGSVVDLGQQSDAVCGTGTGTCSAIALLKYLNSAVVGSTPAGTSRIGYTSDDACNNASTRVYTPVNVVTATNVVIAGVSAKNKFICGIFLYPAGTVNIAVYQATTGTSCVTAQTDIFGGHTTATGFVATAQAGFAVGNGNASMAKTTTVNTDICVTTSAAIQVSGVVVTADQ